MVFILLPVIIIIVSLVWYSMKPVQINTVSITKPISMRRHYWRWTVIWNNQTNEKLCISFIRYHETYRVWKISLSHYPSEYPRVFFGDKSQLQFCYFMRDISLPMNLQEYTKSLLATNLCQKFQSTIFQKILGLLWKIGNHEQAWTVGNHFASS